MTELNDSSLVRLTRTVLQHRWLVLALTAICMALGVWALPRVPVDAFPDTSNVQAQINTVAPALNGEEIEQQITLPVELSLGGLPGLVEVRSVSKFGLSQVVAVFTDDTDIYDARQFILERLGTVELPEGIEPPSLGPISTGLGEIFVYTLSSEDQGRTIEEIRTLHDWVLKPELIKVPGVAEINAWGGHERQYHVVVQPAKLVEYGLALTNVVEALERSNQNVGGGMLVESGQASLIHGIGRVAGVEDIQSIVIQTNDGVPIHIHDVADVVIGSAIRHGAVTAQGRGEVVMGLGYMLLGANSAEVAKGLREALHRASGALPGDIQVDIVYDRTELIGHVIGTVRHNLVSGAILVVLVLFFLMGSLRAGLAVAITIPMSMLFAIYGMYNTAIAASLLSLGAIDFGILVDGSVIMTDANLRALREQRLSLGRTLSVDERIDAIAGSAGQVFRPILFGMGIILIVFLPILTLEGAEGKMFRPMAYTFILALIGALVLALFLSPIFAFFALGNARGQQDGRIMAFFTRLYAALLSGTFSIRGVALGAVIVLIALTIAVAQRLGGEFLPKLSEGALVMNVIRLPGIALEESIAYNTRMERLLLEAFPDEIDRVWARIGTAEVATDPMGIELTDMFVTLRPRDDWKKASNQTELVSAIETVLRDLPGQNVVFSQPIELRMNELSAGIRSDIGIKIIGDNFDELTRLGNQVQQILTGINGSADISVDQISGQPTLQVTVNKAATSRLGIENETVLSFVEALGAKQVGEVVEGQRKFPLAVTLPEELRRSRTSLEQTLVPAGGGMALPLHEVAQVTETEGIANINREWGRRLIRVQTNVRDRDVLSYVAEAQERIDREIELPEGYLINWGGQFEHLSQAQRRLMTVVPAALILVFLLLYVSLNNLKDVLIVYSGIPFAAVGGVLCLYARGIPFSVSAAIGFIALTGIAVLDGQVMIAAIRSYRSQGLDLRDAAIEGAKQRLRPVLATSITDALGFLPMALSTGVGAEVQRPLATVVIGGVVSCTVLTLFILPVLYFVATRGDRVRAETTRLNLASNHEA
ncbi:MAG: hypothetical protein AMXMBFR84_17120 [Candidatus Hydrogenedentota bacterium]